MQAAGGEGHSLHGPLPQILFTVTLQHCFIFVLVQEHLAKEREELDRQRETYQQDLERLRESTRAVEKEKERLENQRKIKRKTIEVGNLWWT